MLSFLVQSNYCYNYLINQIPMGLLLYSHLPVAFAALAFSVYVFFKSKKDFSSLLLLAICSIFTIWCIFDLSAWFSFLGSANTMFTWSLLDFMAVLMFFFSYYFLYVFATGRDLPLWQKIAGMIAVLPTTYVAYMGLNIPSYDLNACIAVEDRTFTIFTYYAEALFILASFVCVIFQYRRSKDKDQKRRTLLIGTGVLIFLLFFFSASFLVSLYAATDASSYVYNYLIYGLFGMPVFLIYLGYIIVRYKAFNLNIFIAQAIIVTLIALVTAQFAFLHDLASITLNSLNLIFVSFMGVYLARNVRKEIKQREQIEKLAVDLRLTNKDLENANDRLKDLDKQKTEFVSFATHQLRSPLTAMKGYSSLILEGDYGEISPDLRDAVGKIHESTNTLTTVVNDYLNISRIELGTMKYDFKVLDLKDVVRETIGELQPNIDKAGIKFTFEVDARAKYLVKIDIDKFKQVLANIIDNSIKYTPAGSVVASVKKDVAQNTVTFSVKDTGIGMAADVIPKLFAKFSRAENANKVNIRGTGLGLYVAKEIVKAHGGKVWAESEGEGKGSQFYVQLPAEK